MPVSVTAISDAVAGLPGADRNPPAFRGELDGVREQVPQHLLEARGIGEDVDVLDVPRGLESSSSLSSAAGRTLSSAASSTGTSGSGSSSICSLPVVMRDMSTRSLTSCACACALRSISSSACVPRAAVQVIVQQHARPAEDDVQRRAELVRERGQELVLQAVRLAQPAFGALVGQVGDDHRDRAHAVDVQRDRRQLGRVRRAGGGPQLHFLARRFGLEQARPAWASRRASMNVIERSGR